eukprot:TRINITY_DN11792_c0_g1_i2.p1 TRINITY_DN11792_c0_g1~~TRINITY_DN11792_c0_g1_i2.p1  ORF type:complete len:103 (-),score=14.99 TRINITY_DN11792_c0_g1_i2:9-317(-)
MRKSKVKVLSQPFSQSPQSRYKDGAFNLTTFKANKLRMGKNKTITSFFEDRVVVHLNHMPLVISFIGDANLNVGALHAFSNDIKIAVEPLKNSILEKERYNS